jgi:hypothetical protein
LQDWARGLSGNADTRLKTGGQMLDPHHHYFPEADDPAIAPFATAFLRMMFAHAEFEARANCSPSWPEAQKGLGQRANDRSA